VNDVFRRHSSASGEDGFARRKTSHFCNNAFAFLQDRRPTCAVDRAIDSASTEQRGIGGIDDGLGRFFGDVGRTIKFNFLAVSESEPSCEIGHAATILSERGFVNELL
jgi:hypothetical protein